MCVFKRKSFTVIEASKQKIYEPAVHLKTVELPGFLNLLLMKCGIFFIYVTITPKISLAKPNISYSKTYIRCFHR